MLKIIISLIVTASISCQKHLDNNETEIGQNDIKDWKIHSELFQVDLEPKFNPT